MFFPRVIRDLDFNVKCVICVCVCMYAKSLQLCPTLYDSMGYSPPAFCVQGILQARILEWVAMPSYRGSSQPRDQIPCVVCFTDRCFIAEPTREVHTTLYCDLYVSSLLVWDM